MGHGQRDGHGARRRAVQHAAPRRRLRRLHRDDRQLGEPGWVPQDRRLVRDQQRAGEHQLPHLPQGHRHWRVLVHGRARRRPALQRQYRRGVRLGPAAGGAHFVRHLTRARHVSGGLHGRGDSGECAQLHPRPRQRLEHGLYIRVQRQGEAVPHPGIGRPGRLQRVRGLHHGALALQGRRLLRPERLGVDLRDRDRLPDPEHLRVDLRAGDLKPVQRPVRLVPQSRGRRDCAQFFGGQTSSSAHALMWQWSGGGGVRNGFGDFDQIDSARQG